MKKVTWKCSCSAISPFSALLFAFALAILVESSSAANRGFHGFGHAGFGHVGFGHARFGNVSAGSMQRNFTDSPRRFSPRSGFAPSGRFGSSRGSVPGSVRGNSTPLHSVARPVHLKPVPVHATPGMNVPAGSRGMVTRRFNVNPTTIPVPANVAAAIRPANTLAPLQPISPTFTYQSAFPTFQSAFPFFPFFASANPFFGYGYPYSYLGYPYDIYGSGLYVNPYAFAGSYSYNPYGFAGSYGYPNTYAIPYIDAGTDASVNPYRVANSYATTALDVTPLAKGYGDRRQVAAVGQVEVDVPDANAEVWFNGKKTTSHGKRRFFTSPPLDRGANHVVAVRATWREGGQNMMVERTINLTAGTLVRVEFSKSPVRVTGGQE